MKHIRLSLFPATLLLLALPVGVCYSETSPVVLENPVLVFQSGFEATTQMIPHGVSANTIVGSELGLEKSDWDALRQSGEIRSVWINYTGGDETKRFAKIIPEPGRPENHVLQFWLNDSWLASENQVKARIQLEFHSIQDGLKEFYQTVRVFLTDDFNVLKLYPHRIGWLTISEFWNNEWWVPGEKHGFRVTLGIGKAKGEGQDLHFILNAEDAGMVEVWNADNPDIKVPIGKWFTMDYYFKEGDKSNGRFYMTIQPDGEPKQLVFDVRNYTHMTKDPAPNGVTGYNPLKLYTSNQLISYVKSKDKTLQIYWDDLRLWKNKQP